MAKQTAHTWLNKKGLTVREFCDRTGIKYAQAEGWFRDLVKTPRTMLRRIREVFPDFPGYGG